MRPRRVRQRSPQRRAQAAHQRRGGGEGANLWGGAWVKLLPVRRTARSYRGPRLGWREALLGEQKREVRIETGVGTYEGGAAYFKNIKQNTPSV